MGSTIDGSSFSGLFTLVEDDIREGYNPSSEIKTGDGSWLLRVEPRLHALSGSKERNGLSADRNQGTSSRISASPACPKLYKKNSKSP
jgi:hypothetical protein